MQTCATRTSLLCGRVNLYSTLHCDRCHVSCVRAVRAVRLHLEIPVQLMSCTIPPCFAFTQGQRARSSSLSVGYERTLGLREGRGEKRKRQRGGAGRQRAIPAEPALFRGSSKTLSLALNPQAMHCLPTRVPAWACFWSAIPDYATRGVIRIPASSFKLHALSPNCKPPVDTAYSIPLGNLEACGADSVTE